MAQESLIKEINDWLVDQALGQPDIAEMFGSACHRLAAIGVPVARARLTWRTLHPLFGAETLLWRRGQAVELEQFNHSLDVSETFLRSPMHFVLDNDLGVFRRRLEGPDKLLDFDVVAEMAEQGYTDYLLIATAFTEAGAFDRAEQRGILVGWTTDRVGGFSNSDLDTLQRIQRRFAVACKTAIQARIAETITHTYLGRQAGRQVLSGSIKLGDGEETNALVWFSDLRNSTRLAETLPSAEFIKLLNAYFECAATPAMEAGGEVLAFIGDAVLAIFPIENEADLPAITERVFLAVSDALARCEVINGERRQKGLDQIRFGVALNIGKVMFGNIGVPERLAFSAIGPTVIEVSRIEKMTKTLGNRVLATRDIAEFAPDLWRQIGYHRLDGFGEPKELFAFAQDVAAQAAA